MSAQRVYVIQVRVPGTDWLDTEFVWHTSLGGDYYTLEQVEGTVRELFGDRAKLRLVTRETTVVETVVEEL
jgi:hypothetical protein